MQENSWNILYVENDRDDYFLVLTLLSELGRNQFDLRWAASYEEALPILQSKDPAETPDVILVDYYLEGHTGLDLAREAIAAGSWAPIILLTGRGGYEVDVEAMQAGVADFLPKNELTAASLERTIRYAIERKRAEEALRRMNDQLELLVLERTAELAQANEELRAEVAERKRVEIELMEREARLRLFLEQAPAVLWSTDVELRFTSSMGKGLEALGLQPNQLVGVSVSDYSTQLTNGGPTLEAHRRALQGDAVTYETESVGHTFSSFIQPFRNPLGEIIGTIGIALDSTDRKRNEEALARRGASLQLLKDIAVTANQAASVEEAFTLALQQVCTFAGCSLGHVYETDLYDPEKLISTSLWYSQDPELFGSFREVTEQTPLRFGEGVPGKVLEARRQVWAKNLAEDLSPARAKAARENGIRTAFAFPVLIGSKVGAVFEFFSLDELAPDDLLIDLIEQVGTQIGRVVERRRASAELAEMQRRLMDSIEIERLKLAQKLHDEAIQDLYGVAFQFESLRDYLTSDESLALLNLTQTGLKDVIQTLRVTYNELRPPALVPFGLDKAIRSHTEYLQEEHPDLVIRLELASFSGVAPEGVAFSLFRIYQQAINNAVQHSQANQVTVRLRLEEAHLVLEIQDDGCGFEVPEHWLEMVRQGRYGLASAAERAAAIGGVLKVFSGSKNGTIIQVVVPRSWDLISD